MTKEEYFIEARDAFYTLNDLKKYNIPKELYDNICAQFYALGASYNEQFSFPSNLDEAAHDYAWEKQDMVYDAEGEILMDYGPRYDAFKVGAEWMASQGVSVNAISSTEEDGITEEGMKLISDYLESLPNKTEVVLQIRKKH